MTPLLERNEQFARSYTTPALGLPAALMVVVSCLDHRVDPAIVLGLRLGDAPVVVLDALRLGALLALPVGRLEAPLRIGAGLSE